MSEAPLVYPILRTEVKRIVIPASVSSFQCDSLTQSSVNPDSMLLVFIPQEYWEGGYSANPLEFVHSVQAADGRTIQIDRSCLSLNGVALEQDPQNSPRQVLMAAFRQLYNNLGQLGKKDGLGLEFVEFIGGQVCWLYDLTRASRAADKRVRHPVKDGVLRYQVSFNQTLPKALNLFCISVYHSSFQVDKSRNVQFNFVN